MNSVNTLCTASWRALAPQNQSRRYRSLKTENTAETHALIQRFQCICQSGHAQWAALPRHAGRCCIFSCRSTVERRDARFPRDQRRQSHLDSHRYRQSIIQRYLKILVRLCCRAPDLLVECFLLDCLLENLTGKLIFNAFTRIECILNFSSLFLLEFMKTMPKFMTKKLWLCSLMF